MYGAKWPAGPHTPSHVAPDHTEISTPAATADEQPAGQLACQPKSDRMPHADKYTLHRHLSVDPINLHFLALKLIRAVNRQCVGSKHVLGTKCSRVFVSYGCNYVDIDATCAFPQGQVDTIQHVGIFKATTAQYHSSCTVLLPLSINESAQDLMRVSGVSEGVVTNRTHEHNE